MLFLVTAVGAGVVVTFLPLTTGASGSLIAPALLAHSASTTVARCIAQNASPALMFDRVSTDGYDMVSAIWNLAFDAGMGLGAIGFGVIASQIGYAAAFGSPAH
jgi:predicted MFS family arabinose efflux permease